MKTELINYIKNTDTAISILVDTTTDVSVKNYLSVYLRILENSTPRCFFYDLILVNSEKAANLRDLIVNTLRTDGIYDHVKKYIIGFASDGASVMTGDAGGLGKLLGDHFGKSLYRVHCAPHKLQLAITHAYKTQGLEFLKGGLENTVNSVYTFYNRNAVKRKASLRLTAEALAQTFHELNYIFKIRWVSSEFSALDRINKNYVLLVTNLESIQASQDFDADTTNVATGLLSSLSSIRFRGILLFLMDVLNVLTTESKRLQDSAGTLIGLEKYREELVNTMLSLKSSDGPAVQAFLSTYKCFKEVGRLVRCNAKDMDDKNFVLTEQFTLTPQGRSSTTTRREIPKLSELRSKIIDSLVYELKRYFPEGSLLMFDVLRPSLLPDKSAEVFSYSGKIFDVAKQFSIPAEEVSNEFAFLLHSLLDDHATEYYLHKTKDDPIEFWSHFLRLPTVQWNSNIKRLIETVLAVPIATADVERGFSILTHIRSDRRSRLTVEHMKDIMFARINGPEVSNLNAVFYAKKWAACGGMRTDDPRKVRRTKPANELPKTNLF